MPQNLTMRLPRMLCCSDKTCVPQLHKELGDIGILTKLPGEATLNRIKSVQPIKVVDSPHRDFKLGRGHDNVAVAGLTSNDV